MKARELAVPLLLGCCLCAPARADIYAHTDSDGSVSLSNVPTEGGYTLLVGTPRETVAAPPAATAMPGHAGKSGYDRIVEQVSSAYGVDSALLHAVISVESGYNPKAVSKKGAEGLMQLMPETARRYGVADALDPLQNLQGGARYLRDLLHLFDNNVSLALAAYNAGEHAVTQYGNRIPPYRETQRYVPKVLDFYRRYRVGL